MLDQGIRGRCPTRGRLPDVKKRRKTKVMLTGAAGRIGSAFFRHARGLYDFRLADRDGYALAELEPGVHETLVFDLSDAAACHGACEEVDVVVHLAADPSPEADFENAVLPNTIVGSYNIFESAHMAGCRRAVVASSAQAVEAYPVDVQVRPETSVRPKNLYGVSKCFVEALASYYATEKNLSSVAVRIGAFEYPEDHETMSARDLSAFVSPRDLCQLLCQCVDAPEDIRFSIAHAVSNNRFKRLDISYTRNIFGYRPEDDAFQIFGVDLD